LKTREIFTIARNIYDRHVTPGKNKESGSYKKYKSHGNTAVPQQRANSYKKQL